MTIEQAIEEAKKKFKEKFKDFEGDIIPTGCYSIPKNCYKPFACYAITFENSCVVSDFFVTLVLEKDEPNLPKFIYTVYDQRHGKNGIYKFCKTTFKCIKCHKTYIIGFIPLVVISENPFEAARLCEDCLKYCREHGLKLFTIDEYQEKQRGI